MRGTRYRWIDPLKLSQALLKPDDEIHRVRYFTALTVGAASSTIRQQQETYIRALRTISGLTVHLGLFVAHKRAMPRADGGGTVEELRTDEKGSDVNLASHLLLDACSGDFDKALIVSNDNDFAFPVRAVRDRLGLTIGVSCPVAQPGRRPARLLVHAASFTAHLTRKRRTLLRHSQFPNPVIDSTARPIHRPPTW